MHKPQPLKFSIAIYQKATAHRSRPVRVCFSYRDNLSRHATSTIVPERIKFWQLAYAQIDQAAERSLANHIPIVQDGIARVFDNGLRRFQRFRIVPLPTNYLLTLKPMQL